MALTLISTLIFAVLPAGWVEYPGSEIDSAEVIFYTQTLDADLCLRLCASNPVCSGANFNSHTGMCHFAQGHPRCRKLQPKSGSYFIAQQHCR